MKTYGTAVLTALQARNKRIDDVAELIKDRRLKAFIAGEDSEKWLSCFWQQMAVNLQPNKEH